MKTDYFNYHLPKQLIAQVPVARRDQSSLMVLDRSTQTISHKKFYQIHELLSPGDILVINNTKVIPARLIGTDKQLFPSSSPPVPIGGVGSPHLSPKGRGKAKGLREILLVKKLKPGLWEALINPQKGLKIDQEITFNSSSLTTRIISKTPDNTYIIQFSEDTPLTRLGYAPLPPYIKRDYTRPLHHQMDRIRYQTVYAKTPGAIAAPTAGMHFTENLLEALNEKGIVIIPLTLHVGIGTFRPIRTESIIEHKMQSEWYSISPETAEVINNAKRNGQRIIAVGTTTVRALEDAAGNNHTIKSYSGYTDLFIYPSYRFKIVDALITNFHLPRSTLLVLVSAFAGREFIMEAYKQAIKNKYRFYSYGDAMLIM